VMRVLVAVRGAEQPVVVVVQLLVQRRRIGPRRARCEHVVTRRMNRHHASASPIVVAIQPLLFPIATFNIEATRELKIVMVLSLATAVHGVIEALIRKGRLRRSIDSPTS